MPDYSLGMETTDPGEPVSPMTLREQNESVSPVASNGRLRYIVSMRPFWLKKSWLKY